MKKPDAGKWKAVILTAMLLLLPAAQADAAGMPESGIQDYIQNPGQEADSFAGHTENNETEAGGHQAEYTDSQGIIYHLDGNACCVSGYTENLPDSATIPEQLVTENGIYSVKGIQQQAFTACSQLKKIKIKSEYLEYIGEDAFRGIHAKAVIYVPESCLKEYRAMVRESGNSKVKVKAL